MICRGVVDSTSVPLKAAGRSVTGSFALGSPSFTNGVGLEAVFLALAFKQASRMCLWRRLLLKKDSLQRL